VEIEDEAPFLVAVTLQINLLHILTERWVNVPAACVEHASTRRRGFDGCALSRFDFGKRIISARMALTPLFSALT
jgi:hypothetical protein